MKKLSDQGISRGFVAVALLLSLLLMGIGCLYGFTNSRAATIIAVMLAANIIANCIWLIYAYKHRYH